MRAACPRAGGRPDWPAPVVGSPRKPCRARCARLARARADRAAAAPTPGPSLMAADRPGGMRAGAPSCGKAGDACRDLQRDEGFDGAGASLHGAPWPSQSDKCAKGRKRLCHAAFRDAGERGAATVPRRRTDRFRHCNAMRKCRGGAGMALASAGAHWPALCRALGAWCPGRSVRCTVETGLTSVMHASNRRASRQPDGAVCGHAETGTPRVAAGAPSPGLGRGARRIGGAGRCRSGRCRGHGGRCGAGDRLGAGLAALAAGAAEHGDDCQHGRRACARVAGHGCLLAPARGQRMRRQMCLVLL